MMALNAGGCSYAEYWRRRLAADETKNIMAVVKTHPSTPGMIAESPMATGCYYSDDQIC